MRAVWLRLRSELRARGHTWVALGVLIGLVAGLAVAAAAGARRTESVYPRFLAAHLAADVAFFDDGQTPPNPPAAQIAALPQVVASARGKILYSLDDVPGLVPRDGALGRDVHRFTMLDGRRPDPRRVDEVMIGFVLAERLGLRVGSTFPLIESEHEDQAAREGIENITLRVVGIEASPGEFPPQYTGTGASANLVYYTPAFYRRYARLLPERDSLLVRLRRGAADVPSFLAAVERLNGGRPTIYSTQEQQSEPIQRAFDLQAAALWILAGLVGLAAALVFAQTLARQAFLEADEAPLLRALGMTRRQVWLVALARAGVIGTSAAVAAVGVAVLVSPAVPLGVARKAEIDPGFDVDAAAFAAGAAATFALVVLLSIWPAWRAAGVARDTLGRARLSGRRPSRLAGRAGRLGLPLSAAAGARFALEPGRGRTAVPVRTTLAGLALAIAALTGALWFAASLDHLLGTPRLYGWNWDLAITNYGSGPDLRTRLRAVDGDTRVIAYSVGEAPIPLAVGNVEFAALAVEGPVAPPVVEGRAPAAADEIALATKTLRRLGLEIGDAAAFRIPGIEPRRLVIVGRTVLPPPVEARLGEGGLLTFAGLLRFVPDLTAGFVFLDVAPGADRNTLLADLRPRLGEPFVVVQQESPTDIVNFGRIRRLPVILAAVLAVLAIATLAHTLVSSVRRRGRDLAILKTLGFVRRQVLATVAWEATMLAALALLVGMPLGIVAGRWAWSIFADRSGVAVESTVPGWELALVIVVVLAVANVVAIVPARLAASTQPARELRAE
jgi:ABC-type lipoprotein release transport system permease subunit